MASTPQGRQLTENHRAAQAALAAVFLRELLVLWRGFDAANVDRSWPAIRVALITLVRARHRISAGLSATYYQQFRAIEHVATPAAVGGAVEIAAPELVELQLAEPPPLPLIEATVDLAGPISFKQAVTRGNTPEQARDRALVTEQGAASRLVLDGGRATLEQNIQHDREALGWACVTDANPCAFCAMLASRGPVYRTQESAGDPRGGGMPWHFHCGCTAEPVFSRTQPWPGNGHEYDQLWQSVAAGLRGDDARRAFRRAVEGRTPQTPAQAG